MDDTIIHYGVKGMRWGVRNTKPAAPKSTRSRKKKVAGAIALGVGAAAVAVILSRSGSAPVKAFTPTAVNVTSQVLTRSGWVSADLFNAAPNLYPYSNPYRSI